ncbi:ImmA/IrrE family metallo-endopeptidase [Mycobacterium sp. C31M]
MPAHFWTPAQRAAALVRDRTGASIPVDLIEVVDSFADMERAEWPNAAVDGITVNCAGARPRIFYRGAVDDLRTRFTIAHELGHAVLPWHIGTAQCVMPAAAGSAARRSSAEREADEFAAELLLPRNWLRRLVRDHRGDLTPVLSDVGLAQASATASLIALERILTVGWALQMNNQPLILAHLFGQSMDRAEADRTAFASGAVEVHQQTIRWWRLFDLPAMPDVPEDKSSAYASLDRAWASGGGGGRNTKSIDSSVSATIGVLGGLFETEVAFGYLLHRLRLNGDSTLAENPDFQEWLVWKSVQGASQFKVWG